MDDELDPIVHERTVFLSKQLQGNLILLQYPVRSRARTYDQAEVLSTRVKPKQQCIEMELALNVKSRHYSVTGAKDTNCKDKQTLTSVPSGAEISRFAVGVLGANELHLTPLSGIVQLRPNYSYIDTRNAQLAAEASAINADDSVQDDAEDDVRPVTVRFKAHESEDALARRMASYEHHRQQADEEAWVSVQHYPYGSEESALERDQLFADNPSQEGCSEFYTTVQDYQKQLIPRMVAEVSAVAASLPSGVLSLAALKSMSFADRVQALIRSVRTMRFAELMGVLKSLCEGSEGQQLDVHDVLRHVQQYAVLVQGCWVVKSDVLYKKDSVSELTGTPAEALCRARDFVLWCFEQGRTVSRKDVASAGVRLAPEDEREILDKIAKRSTAGRGWVFLMARDTDFLADERYRQVIKRQDTLWQQWQASKSDPKQPTQTASVSASVSPKLKRARSRTKSSCSVERSMSEHSDTDVETPRRATETNVDVQPASSENVSPVSSIVPSLGCTSGFASASSSTVSTAEIVCPMELVNSSSTTSVPSALVDFARERLANRTVLSVASLRLQLDLFLASSPAGSVLGVSGLSSTPQMLEQALVDAGAMRIVATNGRTTETVFVLTQRGDSADPLRAVIVEMLSARSTLKIGSVRKKVEEKGIVTESGNVPNDNELRAVLKEFCVTKAGCWVLKETGSACTDS